ncbi:MAG: hypothetical protein AAF447_22530 [Myxococcota bacterium]
MKLPADYVDLLRLLLRAEAEFVVVGGWAVAAAVLEGPGRANEDD